MASTNVHGRSSLLEIRTFGERLPQEDALAWHYSHVRQTHGRARLRLLRLEPRLTAHLRVPAVSEFDDIIPVTG
jgi:hypothetical protein